MLSKYARFNFDINDKSSELLIVILIVVIVRGTTQVNNFGWRRLFYL